MSNNILKTIKNILPENDRSKLIDCNGDDFFKKPKRRNMNTLDKQKIKTAINIQTGDDGSKAKKILEILEELEKMTLKEYREQQKNFG